MTELGLIRDALKRREDVQYQTMVLNQLKKEISDLLALAGDETEQQRRAMLESRARRMGGVDWK